MAEIATDEFEFCGACGEDHPIGTAAACEADYLAMLGRRDPAPSLYTYAGDK